jgi:hypothetical protein
MTVTRSPEEASMIQTRLAEPKLARVAVAAADVEVEGDYYFERVKVGTSTVQLARWPSGSSSATSRKW